MRRKNSPTLKIHKHYITQLQGMQQVGDLGVGININKHLGLLTGHSCTGTFNFLSSFSAK